MTLIGRALGAIQRRRVGHGHAQSRSTQRQSQAQSDQAATSNQDIALDSGHRMDSDGEPKPAEHTALAVCLLSCLKTRSGES